ncbi:hypothetical protein [Blastococcus goldschmidtiae]|uniref:PH domain-containing protein n=1 Tax=Blastococcus goldschmidtiae TaxID=3075546 RepID=A0ABU2K2S5_9ACTN|nr:hypothetical protein [Blastococcus sp. DSM 46792]MDT0274491.1 hypothetical protein [Blastococcus sp. DSM 46792]
MTSAEQQLVLRPPGWARGWVVVFPVLFAGFLFFILRPDEPPVWALASVMLAGTCVLAWRLHRLAAIGGTDGALVVRNHWRDLSLDRADISAVEIGRVRGGTGNLAVQLTVQGSSTVRLDVTEVPFRPVFGRRLERQADQVRAWVSGRPQPYR